MEEGRSADLAPPAFITSSPAKAGNGKKKPPPTPTEFWNTPVGRSLGASAVGWATKSSSGGGGGGDVSRQRDTLNHSETEREDAGGEGRSAGQRTLSTGGLNGDDSGNLARQRDDAFNLSECEGTGEAGGGVDHPTLGNSGVGGIGSGAPPTRRENGQSCDEGASTKRASERVVVPTSTATQENPRSDKTHDTPAAHTASSDETCDPPAEPAPSSNGLTAPPVETSTVSPQDPTESARRESDPTPVEYDALAEERRQNTRPMKFCGADRDKEVRMTKGGKRPPAQGTGTKAVRSLSQVAGGRALAEVEGEQSSLLFESATGSTRKSLGRSLGELISYSRSRLMGVGVHCTMAWQMDRSPRWSSGELRMLLELLSRVWFSVLWSFYFS